MCGCGKIRWKRKHAAYGRERRGSFRNEAQYCREWRGVSVDTPCRKGNMRMLENQRSTQTGKGELRKLHQTWGKRRESVSEITRHICSNEMQVSVCKLYFDRIKAYISATPLRPAVKGEPFQKRRPMTTGNEGCFSADVQFMPPKGINQNFPCLSSVDTASECYAGALGSIN